MQVEAKWKNGAFHPLQPLKLKYSRVTIVVPDEEIEIDEQISVAPEIERTAQKMLQQFENIRNAPIPDEKEIPAWTEKKQERLEAFELRRKIREEQCCDFSRPDPVIC